jgi:drug/metabolite transporter (DMT)-like permease
MGLAAIPLAEIEAIRFSIPLMITILSVLFLSEKVNLRRWLTLLVGFMGILIVIKPGSATFNIGSIFILISVLFYALTVILTRSLHKTDSSATMAYYSSLTYLAAALVFSPLMLIFNETPNIHPSFAFLVRPWQMPSLIDGVIMAGLGLVWAAWTFFMAKAYSVAQASVVAPFEYSSLPINILWGIIIWQEMPTLSALFGALLTISSGIYIFYYDRKHPSEAQ